MKKRREEKEKKLKLKEEKRIEKELKKEKARVLTKKRVRIVKKKTFESLNKLGLIKTEKEKKERDKESDLGKLFVEKELEGGFEEFKKVKAVKKKLEIPELVSRKKGEVEKKIERPYEVIKSEEEIKKAIEGIKEKKKKPSILKKLFKKRVEVEEKVERPEIMPRIEEKVDVIYLIEEKMHKARIELMDFKFGDAKGIYVEIMKMYNGLEPKKKAKVYQDIKDLYYERKSAERYAKV